MVTLAGVSATRVPVIPQPLQKTFRDWWESIRRYGPHQVLAYLFDIVRVRWSERFERFDDRFGTDTAAVVYPWDLPSVGGKYTSSEIHTYEAVPAWLLREILEFLPLQPHRFAFVDMGAGKGRALLVASEWPFAKIVGVEISAELNEIAEDNIKRYRPATQQCGAFSLHCMDATDYTFEPEPVVVFLFNPFGHDTLSRILANLQASLLASPHQGFVVYVNPRFAGMMRRAQFLKTVRKGGAWWRPWSRYVIYEAKDS
jgi:predicted RNA methylase